MDIKVVDISLIDFSSSIDFVRAESIVHPAYVAGIIDGEGSITIMKSVRKYKSGEEYNYYQLRICVDNHSKELIRVLYNAFGGSNYICKKDLTYKWVVTSKDVYSILKWCYNYLVIKKEQADICFEFFNTTINRGLSDEVNYSREKLYSKMKLEHKRFTMKYKMLGCE